MPGNDDERLDQMRQTGLMTSRQRNLDQGQSLNGERLQTGWKYNRNPMQQFTGQWRGDKSGLIPVKGGGAKTTKPIDQIGGPIEVISPIRPVRPIRSEFPSAPEQDDWESLIDSIYENSRESQLSAIEGQYSQQKNDYDRQKEKAPEKFNPLRNEAYVNNEMAERSRKEAMANMGLSGAGGMSQTLQQRNTGNLLNTLGGISRQQQDFTDNINFALGQLASQYDSNKNSINLQIDSEKGRAMLDQGNWEKNYGLQQDQFELTSRDSEFNRYMALYKKGLINKSQFKHEFPEYF